MPESELKLRFATSGTDKAAANIKKVDKAQEGLTKGVKSSTTAKTAQTSATTDGAVAQTQLNAAEGDFIAILAATNPVLARVADTGLKATKIFSSMADAETGLAGVGKKLTKTLAENASALKLVGAAGAAVAAVFVAYKVFQKLEADATAATAALNENTTAVQDNQKARDEAAGKIRDQADARKRSADLSVEESRAIDAQAKSIRDRNAELDRKAAAGGIDIGGILEQTRESGLTRQQQETLVQAIGGGATFQPAEGEDPLTTRGRALDLLATQQAQEKAAEIQRRNVTVQRDKQRALRDALQAGQGDALDEALRKRGIDPAGDYGKSVGELSELIGGTPGGLETGLDENLPRSLGGRGGGALNELDSLLTSHFFNEVLVKSQSERGGISGLLFGRDDTSFKQEVITELRAIFQEAGFGGTVLNQHNYNQDAEIKASKHPSPEGVGSAVEGN